MSVEDFKKELEQEMEALKTEDVVEDNQEATQHSEAELEAMKSGWKPKDEFSGDNFVSAEEFLSRGSFFKKIDSQNKKIETLTETVKELLNHNKSLEKVTYEKAMKEILAKRDQAVEDADVLAFKKAELEAHELTQQFQPKQPQPKQEVTQELLDFKERNSSWFNKETDENSEMTEAALIYDNYLGQINQQHFQQTGSYKFNEQQQIKLVEDRIRKYYPHRFENQNKDKPAMVGKSTVSSSSGKSSVANRMSEQQKRFAKEAANIDPSFSIEEYAKQLESLGKLQK